MSDICDSIWWVSDILKVLLNYPLTFRIFFHFRTSIGGVQGHPAPILWLPSGPTASSSYGAPGKMDIGIRNGKQQPSHPLAAADPDKSNDKPQESGPTVVGPFGGPLGRTEFVWDQAWLNSSKRNESG